MTEPQPRSRYEDDLEHGRARVDEKTGTVVSVGPSSWTPVDLGPILRGEKRAKEPKFLKRSDGQPLLYPGAPHIFFGPSESLKSWAAFLAAASFLDEGFTVLFVDFESNDVSFVERARKVGVKDGYIGNAFVYVRPDEPLYFTDYRTKELKPNEDAVFALTFVRESLKPSLIVLDGVTECYALMGWDINRAEDAAKFQSVFGGWGDNVSSIAIDHSGKDAERGQIGSQHKRAGLDGAQFEFESTSREGKGGHSTAKVFVRKDRHGSIRAFAPTEYLGTIHVSDTVWIQAPTPEDDPTVREHAEVIAYIEANPGLSGRGVAEGLHKDEQRLGKVLKRLAVDGLLRFEAGPRNAHLWHAVPVPDLPVI